MKQLLKLCTFAICILCFTFCKSDSKAEFTATSTGVGPVQLGLLAEDIPASYDGLYDSFTEEYIEHYEGDYTVLHFNLSGALVMDANISPYDNKIESIEVLGTKIASEDGITPGTKVKELFDKGAKAMMWNDGSLTIELNNRSYNVSGLKAAGDMKLQQGYMTGEDPQITPQDFESGAEVVSFVIFKY